jgi:hypothetical protein
MPGMRTAWRIFVVVTLSVLVYVYAPKWLARGVQSGDYGYAGMMVAIVWWSAFLLARVGSIPDAKFSRLVLGVGTAIAIPLLCYHIYDATGLKQTFANAIFLLGVVLYANWELTLKPRAERRRSEEERSKLPSREVEERE